MATATLPQALTPGQIIEQFQQEAPVNVVGIANALGERVGRAFRGYFWKAVHR
jgi:hypothetical protein